MSTTASGSITFKAQIDYFRKYYQVIAMDSRDHGKSADSPDKITYEKTTDDLAALLAHLNAPPSVWAGLERWGDRGIAARHPASGESEKDRGDGTSMMLDEPHIDPKALEAITAPTLVLASDHAMVLDEHTLEIYHHLPNGELCIFPNATHMVPFDESARFNSTLDRFFRAPYVKKDRIKDLLKSYEALKAQVQ